MIELRCTSEYLKWTSSLDRSVRIRIDQRIQRLTDGNPGFHRRFDQILELKWSTGQMGSFRIYCLEQNNIVLLFGGHKDTQSKDIEYVKQLLKGVIDGQVRTEIYE